VKPYGYTVTPVRAHGCLHLKTAITALDDHTFLVNRGWIDLSPFQKFRLIDVAAEEPWGANVLRIDDQLIVSAASVRTAGKLETLGYRCHRIDVSELAKAEAGLTCMSLIFLKNPG
jgi:dimethylargininase